MVTSHLDRPTVSEEELFLAVDAGGTRTTLVLGTRTAILARAETGSIKRLRVPEETANANLESGLHDLRRGSSADLAHVKRTCVGISGESVPLVRDWVQSAFASRVGGTLLIRGDVNIALDAAFQGSRGVLVLAGTGSNVLGRAGDGKLSSAGGWGPVLGDQGSGYAIARQALFATFRSINAGVRPPFLDAVMAAWQVASLAEVVTRAHALPPPDFAALSPLVARLADQGDSLCLEVLHDAGSQLAEQARGVLSSIHADETADASSSWTPPDVACAGSILHHVPLVRSAMLAALRDIYPAIEVLPGVVDPVMGALWSARCT